MKLPVLLALSAAALLSSASAEPETAGFVAYGESSEFHRLLPDVKPEAGSFAGKAFKGFEAGETYLTRYFAAFAYASGGTYGVAGNYNQLSEAKAAALAGCDARRAKADSGCKVIGIRLPTGYAETDQLTLSAAALAGYQNYLKQPGPKAFVVGSRENWAAQYNAKSVSEARAKAMVNCTWEWGQPGGKAYGGKPCVVIAEEK